MMSHPLLSAFFRTLLPFLLIGIVFFSSQQHVFAHTSGESAYFLINERSVDFYPVSSTSLRDFQLPHDLAPETYLVGTTIAFELVADQLPLTEKNLTEARYTWDFGDGGTAEGLSTTHQYQKQGSYVLTVTAHFPERGQETKQQLEMVMLHVLPNTAYKLPQAHIKINNQLITDPENILPTLPSSTRITFDARASKPGSAPITSYFWDRGDGTTATKPFFTYEYPNSSQRYLFPFLRVKDANGFISDAYVQLDRGDLLTEKKQPHRLLPYLTGGLLVLNVLLIGGIMYVRRR